MKKLKNKNLVLMAGALFLLIALLGAVNLVQRTQETRKGAAEETGTDEIKPVIFATSSLVSNTPVAVLEPGNRYYLKIRLAPKSGGAWQVRAAGANLALDNSKMGIEAVSCGSDFPTAVRNDYDGGNVQLSCYKPNGYSNISASVNPLLGVITVLVKAGAPVGSTTVNFSRTNIPDSNQASAPDLAAEDSVITLNIGGTPPREYVVCKNPTVNNVILVDGSRAEYQVGNYTPGWELSIRRDYGDEITEGEGDNECCGDNTCPGTAINCSENVDIQIDEQIIFFTNLVKTVDDTRYLCRWDSTWREWVPGNPGQWATSNGPEGYSCSNDCEKSISIVPPEPTNTPAPLEVVIGAGQVNPNPATDDRAVTYYAGDYTDDWKTSIHYYYGAQPTQGSLDNICCDGFCDDGETATSCRLDPVDIREGNKLWFFANLAKTIDGVRYICDWEGNWQKWVNGAWVPGGPSGYTCENNSLVPVTVIPSGSIVLSCSSPSVNKTLVDNGETVNYEVNQVSITGADLEIKPAQRRDYGDTITHNGVNNLCCEDGQCPKDIGDLTCDYAADLGLGSKLWFFTNVNVWVGNNRYICAWDNTWWRWNTATEEWEDGSPGGNYICDNQCEIAVGIRDPQTPCPKADQGDLNCDGAIGQVDFEILAECLWRSPTSCDHSGLSHMASTDLTGEGYVNERDISRLLHYWDEAR